MATRKTTSKKVTKATTSTAPAKSKASKAASADGAPPAATWTPTAEGKAKATKFRLIAAVLWALAIAGEAFAIFWILRPSMEARAAAGGFPQDRWWMLIGALVVIGALALTANVLWKKANRLDPASRANAFKFFVQNQLGLIITIIAFVPLIVLILLNKDMSKSQKGIATAVAAVLAVVVGAFGVDTNPPSVEEYDAQRTLVAQLLGVAPGSEEVFWVPGGGVFHLCDGVSAINAGSTSDEIMAGTIAQAIDAGKGRLTKQWQSEVDQCAITIPEGFDSAALDTLLQTGVATLPGGDEPTAPAGQ
jgi:hypothetical protein